MLAPAGKILSKLLQCNGLARNYSAVVAHLPPHGTTAALAITMSNDSTRPRLQLSLGAAALLGEELPSLGGRRVFAATNRETGTELLVTLHPAPPEGPSPKAVQSRLGQLRSLDHPVLILPVAEGNLDGRAWVVERIPFTPTARRRLGDGGALGVRHGVLVLRDVTRALASLHRAGLAHGALDLDSVHVSPTGGTINGFAASESGTQRSDLDALGALAQALFTGAFADSTPWSRPRKLPAGLDSLMASLLAPNPAMRPARAEAILGALDAFPTPHPSPISSFLEGAGRGARVPRAREAVLFLVLVGLSVLVTTVVLGQ